MTRLFKLLLRLALFLFLAANVLPADDLFWEEAELFTARSGRFPVSAHSNNFSVIIWQEFTPNRDSSITTSGTISIYMAVKETGRDWERRGIVAGPYSFLGSEPSITSLVIDNRGRIVIAAAAGSAQTEILISTDRGRSFSRQMLNLGADNSVAPRLFVRADGGYFLFVTRGRSQALSIYFSRSDDGIEWSPFEFFTPENTLSLNFLPTHASVGRRDIVFFQSLIMGTESLSTFQLFFKISDDGGRTWTDARRFTNFNDLVNQTQAPPNSFDNQRPHLLRHGNNFFIVWERRFSHQPPQIYCAVIDSNGNIIGQVERINNIEAFCINPIAFLNDNRPAVVWADNRSGYNRIILAQRGDFGWRNQVISGTNMEASFARPVISQEGTFIFWQTTVRDSGRIYVLAPDTSVSSPRITALNFTPTRANRSERIRVAWNIPDDTSGIHGFSWTWSQDENLIPPEQVAIANTGNPQNMNMELNAVEEGSWYFSIRARDNAGNWSEPAQVMYNRKSIPPPALTIIEPNLDERGFLLSNTFNMLWEPSSDPLVAGYTWNLQFLGLASNYDLANIGEYININAPPSSILGVNTSVNFINQDNGLWVFTAAAIDQAGNIGPQSNLIFRTNKFIPYTNVSYIDAQQDEQGVLTIRLTGRGFSTNGQIVSIVLEQEGRPNQTTESFNILSDREISGIIFENITEGQYRLRLNHSSRGWYTANTFIPVRRTGTVKFGDYSNQWKPLWSIQDNVWLSINPATALIILLIIFCAIGMIAVIRGIGGVIAEGAAVKQEANAIITGDFMPKEKKQKIVQIKRRGSGLRRKLASFTIVLVLLVIIMISTPMYLRMTDMQQKTLLESLKKRSEVLLEGIASSARTHMPAGDVLGLMNLPHQSSAIQEANYITITGYGTGSTHTNHIWASNDPDINSKINTTELQYGITQFNEDELSPIYDEISKEFNRRAQEAAGDISRSIRDLYDESNTLILDTTEEGERRRDDIQVTIRSQEVKLNEILTDVAKEIGSYPEFSTERIASDGNRTYIFYKPIMYRQRADDNFYRGLVRLEVSLDSIISEINNERINILRTIGLVALAVMIIGVIGAFIFSAVIILPVRKLVKHIERIRDTEDKTKLAGVDIYIKSKDEIAILGKTINDMTHGLVKAALAASDLSIGKEIQKKFIPLEVDSQGNKQSSGFKKTHNLDFFGYYEGAKGVSGDYFDFKDLDGRYYAIIKCDVAGKGIPAALIMIQVATMFLGYFRRWKPTAAGFRIENLVYQINDFIEALGFKGRFAAFTLCLFDSETGIVRFCNAGDNIVHVYSASEGKKKMISLPQTPATGVLPNFMIETTGGYNVQTVTIEKGDILLLYTDGIEEAKRKFRDSNFKEILCTHGPVDTPHENHLSGQADEEMTPERVDAIINAVMAREVYTLRKFHNPEEGPNGGGELQFDFTSCEGNVEEVIMAMVSVEKMFRCYKPANAGEDSRVLVDKKVDEFLKNHFIQYRQYCSHTREFPENPAYMYYTHVDEDEQYDDLTILGIKRKE